MKKYALLAMLLIGLLVPMTIASKSIDFQVNAVLFNDHEIAVTVDVLKPVQPQITKSIIIKEVAEGIQKRRFTESKVDVLYISAFPPEHGQCPLMVDGRPIINIQARCKADSVNGIELDKYGKLQPSRLRTYNKANIIYSGPGINQIKDITNYIRADMLRDVSDFNNPGRVCDIADFKKVVLLNAVFG